MYYLAYLQMAGDMEQQIPVISVPMPGKSQQNAQINAERHAISVTVGQLFHLSSTFNYCLTNRHGNRSHICN